MMMGHLEEGRFSYAWLAIPLRLIRLPPREGVNKFS